MSEKNGKYVYGKMTLYYKDGFLHREDGPAEERINGDKEWWINGKRHREDGPAIENLNGYKSWWLNDQLHREDGPAIERHNGDNEWFLQGESVTEEEIAQKKKKKNLNEKLQSTLVERHKDRKNKIQGNL